MYMCVYVHTWIMEEVAESKTCHCSRGSVVALVVCSLCLILPRAGTFVFAAEY